MGIFGNKQRDDDETQSGAPGVGWQSKSTTSGADDEAIQPSAAERAVSRSDDREASAKPTGSAKTGEKELANVGQSIVFEGKLSGEEDLEIAGRVKGDISLPGHQLTVAESGHVQAEISARSVLIVGRVVGDLNASERVEIRSTGVVEGDVRAPRLLIEEGAVINGSIDMDAGASISKSRPAGSRPGPGAGSAKESEGAQPSA